MYFECNSNSFYFKELTKGSKKLPCLFFCVNFSGTLQHFVPFFITVLDIFVLLSRAFAEC